MPNSKSDNLEGLLKAGLEEDTIFLAIHSRDLARVKNVWQRNDKAEYERHNPPKIGNRKQPNGGQTPLLYAVNNGTFDIVKFICDNSKTLLDEPDYGGVTPLIAACEKGSKEIVSFLINSRADRNKCRIEDGFRALEVAIGRGDVFNPEELSKLLKAGADFEKGSVTSKFTPLQVAIKRNNIDALNFLLSKLCPNNSKLDNENAISSIKTAIDVDNLEAIKLLMPKLDFQGLKIKEVNQINKAIEKKGSIKTEIKSLIEHSIDTKKSATGKRKRAKGAAVSNYADGSLSGTISSSQEGRVDIKSLVKGLLHDKSRGI